MTIEPASTHPAARPPVEDKRPPRLMLRIVNPVLRTLLRSPLHRLVSRQLMVLSVEGRRTGRMCSIVVGRYQTDATLLVSASGGWRYNLRGGAPVRLTLSGVDYLGHAELIEDPDEVARIYKVLLDRIGEDRSRMLGLQLNVRRSPTAAEIKPAVAERGIVHVELAFSGQGTQRVVTQQKPTIGRRDQ